jgi:methyl coenzyme M reductase gamma subunit
MIGDFDPANCGMRGKYVAYHCQSLIQAMEEGETTLALALLRQEI